MPVRKSAPLWTALAGTGLLALAACPAFGQHRSYGGHDPCHPAPAPCPAPVQQLPPIVRPDKPGEPAKPEQAPTLGIVDERFGALASETVALAESNVGYIDSAIPRNVIRFRYDAAYNMRRPNRAEFIYGRDSFAVVVPDVPGVTTGVGAIGGGGGGGGGVAGATLNALPIGNGEALLPANLFTYETSLDIQELSAYLEVALSDRLSIFAEVPYRYLNGEVYGSHSGWGDMNFGIKAAFVNTQDTVVSAQLRTYAETGVVRRGLGTDHFSVEPGLLLYQQLSDRLNLEGEFKWWIPIDGTNFAGNLIRYGVGLSFDVVDTGSFRVSPITEVVGWTVLDGRELIVHDFGGRQNLEVVDADGDTIVNLKLGLRVGNDRGDIYAGYGRAISGHNWYEEIYRLEIRLFY